MKLIINNLKTFEDNDNLIKEFEKELYLPSFPNENEREPFDSIKSRIVNDSCPKTILQLIVEDGHVIAGCVSDYYGECNAVEPIYLVVKENMRKHGLARQLIDSHETIYPNLKHIFIETDNPDFFSDKENVIDPNIRMEIYKKLGFSVVPIHYVQPPLGKGMDYEKNLILMHRGKKLSGDDLKAFLLCFYKGLHYENSEELQKMYEEI